MRHPRDVRTYVLARRFKVWAIGMGAFFLAFGIGLVEGFVREPQPIAVVILFVGWITLLLGLIVWCLTRLPTRITLSEQAITFQTVLRRFEIPVEAVISVKVLWSDPWGGMPMLRHKGGKVRLISAMEGFYDFLGRLKEINPMIEIRGL
jgi:hypothetical protein